MKVKVTLNKIASSLNNSAAIDKNGEVYVWGLAKTGILGDSSASNQYSPQCMHIKQMDSQFKATHVSMGLNHIAVIVSYAILDLIDTKNVPPQSISPIIYSHTKMAERDSLNVLAYFEKQIVNKKFVYRQSIERFFNDRNYLRESNKELALEGTTKKEFRDSFTGDEIEEFYSFFCMPNDNMFNLIEYYYLTNKTKIKRTKLLVWGMADSGRLGLKKEVVEMAKQRQKSGRGGDLQLESDDDDDESQIEDDNDGDRAVLNTRNNSSSQQYSKSFENKLVKKQVNEDFKHEIRHVACGHHHTLIVNEKGRIYYFGMGTQGQLGNENFSNEYKPTKLVIKPKQRFIEVACGSSHSMALADNGLVYTWGKNNKGQLGQGHRNDQLRPTQVEMKEQVKAISITCGDQHSAFISQEKELYTWGNGQHFRLGHGVSSDEVSPKKVIVLEDVYVTHVSCGMTHTLAITNEGFVYSWGDAMSGKLGISENTKNQNLPVRVGMPQPRFRKKVYYQVSAGGVHSLALTDEGLLFAWGSSKGGVLGIGFTKDTKDSYPLPQRIYCLARLDMKEKRQIRFYSLKKAQQELKEIQMSKIQQLDIVKKSVLNQGTGYGGNYDDDEDSMKEMEGGDGEIPFVKDVYVLNLIQNQLPRTIDEQEQQPFDKRFICVIASQNNSFMLTNLGRIYACGSPKKGVLIMDPKNKTLIMKKKRQLFNRFSGYNNGGGGGDNYYSGQDANSVSRGNAKNMMQSQMGGGRPTLSNQRTSSITKSVSGTLSGQVSNVGSPSIVAKGNPDGKKANAGGAGGTGGAGTEDGNLQFETPFYVPFFKNRIIYLSCSYTHVIAVSHKGVAYSWGSNNYYQLGLGYHCKYNHIPQKIQGALETKNIAMSVCGDKFSALLTDKGEIWTFGTSDSGVLGHDQKNYYVVTEPKMINDVPPMIFLTCGPQGMMSISDSSKQIYAWGNNLYGQLGIQITNQNPHQFSSAINDEFDDQNSFDQQSTLFDGANQKITKNQIIYTPTKVTIENDRKIKIMSVGMGMFHSVAIDDQNHLYSCGLRKFSGQAQSLSQDSLKGFDDTMTFLDNEVIRNEKFIYISASEYHTLAISVQSETGVNHVFGWGLCNLGNLCMSSQKEILDTLKKMNYPLRDMDLTEPLKEWFTLPINFNKSGKFDLPGRQQNTYNQQENEKLQHDVVYVSAGVQHNLALTRTGRVLTWGSYSNGKLGVPCVDNEKFSADPMMISVPFMEESEDIGGGGYSTGIEVGMNASMYDQSLKKSLRSRMQSQASKEMGSLRSKITKSAGVKTTLGVADSGNGGGATAGAVDEEEGNDVDQDNFDEIDIVENTSFGSNSSRDIFSTVPDEGFDDDQFGNEQNEGDGNLPDSFTDSADSGMRYDKEDSEEQSEVFQVNLFSKNKLDNKRQDEVQKKVIQEEDSCKEENLIKEDKDLEDLSKQIISKCLHLVKSNSNSIKAIESKIECITKTYIWQQKKLKNLKENSNISFSIPSFIIKNSQLYETVFSLLFHHPCYLMNLQKTQLLSAYHLKNIVDYLFRNPIHRGPSNFNLITLTIQTFKHEYSQGLIQINDIQNIQQSSLFWHLYTLLFEKQKMTLDYFKKLIQSTIIDDICKSVYAIARMQLGKDSPQYLANILDYLQGSSNEVKVKADILLLVIQPLMHKIIRDFQVYQQANQQIFSEELLYTHNKILQFAKKHSLKKEAENIVIQRSAENADGEGEGDNAGILKERQVQDRLQYFEFLLDSKLDNFIFLISYSFITYGLSNLDKLGIHIPPEQSPIVTSPTNIKVIFELLERFVNKRAIKVSNKYYDGINTFLLERKDIKSQQKKEQSQLQSRQQFIPKNRKLQSDKLQTEQSDEDNSETSSLNINDDDEEVYYGQSKMELHEQNLDALVIQIMQSLHPQSDYELSVSQIDSLVDASAHLHTEEFLQIPLAVIFQIQNIYCNNYTNGNLFVIAKDRVDKAGQEIQSRRQDPMFIIFQYLQFEPVNVKDFQTEILERCVNLKLSDNLLHFSYANFGSTEFFKCVDCSAIIPLQYIPTEQENSIKVIIKEQRSHWQCSKGHQSSLKDYKCSEFSCEEFIEDSAIKNFRLVKYYNVNKEYGLFGNSVEERKAQQLQQQQQQLTFLQQQQQMMQQQSKGKFQSRNSAQDQLAALKQEQDSQQQMNRKQTINLIQGILAKCDPLKVGENEYVFFENLKKKPKMKEQPELKKNIQTLLEYLEQGFESMQLQLQLKQQQQQELRQSDGLDSAIDRRGISISPLNMNETNNQSFEDQSFDAQEDYMKKLQHYWNEQFRYYKQQLSIIIDNRKQHNERQKMVRKELVLADTMLLENIAKIQDLVSRKQMILETLRSSFLDSNGIKPHTKVSQMNGRNAGSAGKYAVAAGDNRTKPVTATAAGSDPQKLIRQPDTFAFYTTQKLFKKKILYSITFKNIQILEIEKSIKFYIFCSSEGSFEIMIVYAKEEFLDNFTSYNKHLYPNRMLLHKIEISVAQYMEMKRLEYSKTNITFSTETIQITFDMNKLVHMLQKKEGKIFSLPTV